MAGAPGSTRALGGEGPPAGKPNSGCLDNTPAGERPERPRKHQPSSSCHQGAGESPRRSPHVDFAFNNLVDPREALAPAVAASPLGFAHLSCRGPSDRSRHLLCLKSRRKRLRRGCEGQEGVTRVLLGTREHGCSPQGGRGEAAVSPARFPRLLFWPVAGTGETCRKPAGRWASPPLAPHNRPINWLPTYLCKCFVTNLLLLLGEHQQEPREQASRAPPPCFKSQGLRHLLSLWTAPPGPRDGPSKPPSSHLRCREPAGVALDLQAWPGHRAGSPWSRGGSFLTGASVLPHP